MINYTDEQKFQIIKEYFMLEDDNKVKELIETNGDRFTNEVLHKMDNENFKMESLRKDPRLQYIRKNN